MTEQSVTTKSGGQTEKVQKKVATLANASMLCCISGFVSTALAFALPPLPGADEPFTWLQRLFLPFFLLGWLSFLVTPGLGGGGIVSIFSNRKRLKGIDRCIFSSTAAIVMVSYLTPLLADILCWR